MKYTFSTFLLVSIFCITGDVAAKATQKPQVAVFEKIKKAFESKTSKVSTAPTQKTQPVAKKQEITHEHKLAIVAAVVATQKAIAVQSMQEVINETTDKNNKAKFGIAAMVKAFREQATNNNNPEKQLFVQDLAIGEQLLKVKNNDIKQATALAEKLSPTAKKLLRDALEKRYPMFSRLGALKDFVNARELATA